MKYKINEAIGKGTFGVVNKGINLITDEIVAVKILPSKNIIYTDTQIGVYNVIDPDKPIPEVEILKICNHPNIVKYVDTIYFHDYIYLITEYCDYTLLDSIKVLDDRDKIKFTRQLIEGMKYLHSKNIIHRDLSPGNLLITKDNQLKIIDFGYSRVYIEDMELCTQTIWYRAPELCLRMKYSFPIDVWSVGCIIFELFSGLPLFPSDRDHLQYVFSKLGSSTEISWPEAPRSIFWKSEYYNYPMNIDYSIINSEFQSDVKKMLICNPNKRIKMKDVNI